MNEPAIFKLDEQFVSDIRNIIITARTTAIRSVDFERVKMYWKLGERIFIEEQKGQDRAEYGAYLLQNVALEIEKEFGSSQMFNNSTEDYLRTTEYHGNLPLTFFRSKRRIIAAAVLLRREWRNSTYRQKDYA